MIHSIRSITVNIHVKNIVQKVTHVKQNVSNLVLHVLYWSQKYLHADIHQLLCVTFVKSQLHAVFSLKRIYPVDTKRPWLVLLTQLSTLARSRYSKSSNVDFMKNKWNVIKIQRTLTVKLLSKRLYHAIIYK